MDFFLLWCIVYQGNCEATGGQRVKEFWFQFNFGYIIFQPHEKRLLYSVQIPLHTYTQWQPRNSTYLGIFITCSEDGENKNMVKRGIIFSKNVCLKRKLRIFLLGKISDILYMLPKQSIVEYYEVSEYCNIYLRHRVE